MKIKEDEIVRRQIEGDMLARSIGTSNLPRSAFIGRATSAALKWGHIAENAI